MADGEKTESESSVFKKALKFLGLGVISAETYDYLQKDDNAARLRSEVKGVFFPSEEDKKNKTDVTDIAVNAHRLLNSTGRALAGDAVPFIAVNATIIGVAADQDPTLLKKPENYLMGLTSSSVAVLTKNAIPDGWNLPKAEDIRTAALSLQPSLDDHRNLLPFTAEGFYLTKGSPHLQGAYKDGRVDLSNPENIGKLRAAITDVYDSHSKIVDANESWAVTPFLFRNKDKVSRHDSAALVANSASAALTELDDVEAKMRAGQKSADSEMDLGQLPLQPVGAKSQEKQHGK